MSYRERSKSYREKCHVLFWLGVALIVASLPTAKFLFGDEPSVFSGLFAWSCIAGLAAIFGAWLALSYRRLRELKRSAWWLAMPALPWVAWVIGVIRTMPEGDANPALAFIWLPFLAVVLILCFAFVRALDEAPTPRAKA